jgi:hypothetical protein
VDKVVGVDQSGGQRTFTNGEIANIVGKGPQPFKPNGVFLIATPSGGPSQYVVLSFDKATVDPQTHDITFDVDFLDRIG